MRKGYNLNLFNYFEILARWQRTYIQSTFFLRLHWLDNSLVHLLTHLISRQVTQVQCVIDWHCFDQCGMKELAKLCHQAVPLVFLGIVTEEAVQWGVKRVSDLHLWSKSIDDAATSTGLRVEDGSGQWADWAPGLGQRVIILHLKHRRKRTSKCSHLCS